MNFKKTMFALAIGTVALTSHAATLAPYSMLTIASGVNTYDANTNDFYVSSGSWFAMDTNGDSRVNRSEKVALSQGFTALVIGMATSPGASHAGVPVPGDYNAITAPWAFFGATGSDYTTVGITGSSESGLNMSSWTITWNGIPAISLGSGAWTPLNAVGTGMAAGVYANGVAKFSWNGTYGTGYTLDYTATVPANDASGFGSVQYALHLTGLAGCLDCTAADPIPEASTYAMMLAGLGLVGFAARRRKQTKA